MTRLQHLLPACLAATLWVAGCGPVPNDDPTRAVVVQPGPGAVAPASSQDARVVSGTARYYREALAGAEVVARELSVRGEGPVLATAKANTQGEFQLNFPARVPPGKVVQVVARGANGQRVMALSQVPEALTRMPAAVPSGARALLQDAGATGASEEAVVGPTALVLDEFQTLALMVLAPRIKAALELGTELSIANALESLNQAALALGSEGVDLVDPALFDEVVALVFGEVDQILDSEASREALARAIPAEAVDAIVAQAEVLADIIRQEVLDNGLDRPADELTGPLAIGEKDVPSVFQANTDPTDPSDPGTQATTNDPIVPADPDVTIDLVASPPADGVFGAPTGAIEGAAQ